MVQASRELELVTEKLSPRRWRSAGSLESEEFQWEWTAAVVVRLALIAVAQVLPVEGRSAVQSAVESCPDSWSGPRTS